MMTSSKSADQDRLNSRMLETVVSVIALPPAERLDRCIIELVPWLCKRSSALQHLQRDVLIKLLRLCEHQRVAKDHVIIRQGDKGDCFYIQLTGKTSLFINSVRITDSKTPSSSSTLEPHSETPQCISDEWVEEWDERGRKKMVLDRSKFGQLVRTFDAGKSFGELALITDDAVRSASVIADEDNTDLLVIKKQLFDDTLKTKQEEEFRERKAFIDQSILFRNWNPQAKRFLEISLRKESYPFDSYVVTQGQDVEKAGLCFLIRGEAKVVINPHLLPKQYTKNGKGQENQTASDKTRDNVLSNKRPGSSLLNEQVRVRRHEGYLAAERHLGEKTKTVCVVGPGEIIGAIELMCHLKRHTQNVITTRDTELFILDTRNMRTIHNSKQAVETLFNIVEQTLRTRGTSSTGSQIELYSWLLERLLAKKASAAFFKTPASQDLSSKIPLESEQEVITDRLQRRRASTRTGLQTRDEPNTSGLDVANIFYRSKVVEHTTRISLSLLHKSNTTCATAAAAAAAVGNTPTSTKQNQQQAGAGVMTRDALMIVTRHAARLLPRSRRQLERLCRADPSDPTTQSLRDPDHAIHRYIQDDSTCNTASASRCSRATSACVQSQVTNTPGPGLMSRPYSAAISIDMHVNRPFSAVDGNNSHITMATDTMPSRPHTTLGLGAVKTHHNPTQSHAAVADDPEFSETQSDYETDGSDSDEDDVEMMLGISDVARDDNVRDVVFRLTQQKQYMQECRRNVVDTMLQVRPPSGKQSSQTTRRRRSAPRATRLRGHTMTSFDEDTSDEALRQLEDKLRNFYNDTCGAALSAGLSTGLVGAADEHRKHYVVRNMKRFTVQAPDDVPIPAGSVYVRPISRQRPIRSTCRTHVTRRYMIPKNAYAVACESLNQEMAHQF